MEVQSAKSGDGVSRNSSRDSGGNASSSKALQADYHSSKSIWFSKRMLVAAVVFLSFANITMLMNNLNIAVVDMTSNKTKTIGGDTVVDRLAEFQWDTVTIGAVSSVYWFGSIFAFFSGYFVDKLGGSVSSAICMAVGGILTILHPAILYIDYNLFLACRFLTGFCGNSFYVCVTEIYSRWFPKRERSLLTAIGLNGVNVGAAVSFPLFGYIADEFEWKMVFYVSGCVSIFLSFICFIVVKNRPTQDTLISEEELSYILHGTDDASRKEAPHPYKKILLSVPVLALCIGKSTTLWITTVLSLSLPLYIKDLTDKSITEIGIISSIPMLIQIIMFPIVGVLLDAWNNTGIMKLTRIHKITMSSAYLISTICLLTCIFVNDFAISIFFIVLTSVLASIGPSVYEPITVNLSPNDCTVIAGLAKLTASIVVIIARTCVGYMTINHTSQEWNNCFLLSTAVLIFGGVFFMIFASSEDQLWSLSLNSQQERRPLVKHKYRRKSFTESD